MLLQSNNKIRSFIIRRYLNVNAKASWDSKSQFHSCLFLLQTHLQLQGHIYEHTSNTNQTESLRTIYNNSIQGVPQKFRPKRSKAAKQESKSGLPESISELLIPPLGPIRPYLQTPKTQFEGYLHEYISGPKVVTIKTYSALE